MLMTHRLTVLSMKSFLDEARQSRGRLVVMINCGERIMSLSLCLPVSSSFLEMLIILVYSFINSVMKDSRLETLKEIRPNLSLILDMLSQPS